MGLLTPCIVSRGGLLYKIIVPGRRVFAPFKSCSGGLSQWVGGGGGGRMVMDEIDTCIILEPRRLV